MDSITPNIALAIILAIVLALLIAIKQGFRPVNGG